ncbi:uncharacterized protein LOC122797790 [Protopterus annectens]|uniref:uncharacterized protein LOC122797790 n=1 Tax=Protopterus annectens TaxID=7888 RepID=UPI001CFA0D00|nr:uncharacterized protein LOC122797790 [Protopterus annectens]
MGSPCRSSFANLVMSYWEKNFIFNNMALKDKIIFYARFIDDILIIFQGNENQATDMINFFNMSTSFLRFTHTYNEEFIAYLDVRLSKNMLNDSYEVKIFRKSTYSNKFLDFSSQHPIHQKKSVVKRQLVRAARMITTDIEFDKECLLLKQMFTNRHYPPSFLDPILEEVKIKRQLGYFTLILKWKDAIILDAGGENIVEMYTTPREAPNKENYNASWVPEFDQASAPVIYAEIGKELQLTCNVGNAPCEDIRFFWFCQGKQIKRGICVTSPMISPKTEGTFQITTMLKFTVTEKYHCNQFICQIHHPDLQTPIEKSFIVKIKDFPYFLGYVGSTSPCREGISTTLQFSINAMPEDTDKNELCVTWLKNEEQLNNVALEHPCSKRILSKVKLTPSVSDHNMKFVCHLEHSCLKQPLETFHRFALQGRPRLVDTSVEPQVLIVDKTAVINCIIASPDRKVSFHWEKDGTEITDGISSYSCMPFDWKLRRVQNKQFHTTESDKVLYRIELIFTPRDADVQLEYKFIVKHHDLGCCVEETFRLLAQRTEADFSVKKDAELPLPPIDVYATIHKEPNENVKEIIFRMKAERTGNL